MAQGRYILDQLDPKKFISIKGARMHNLKNIDVAIPRNKFVVITGLSGSGKSSLAFDTLYAEGQRRYVESLSAYARQFLGRLNKPEVDYIKGISPAIAIEQKVNSRNPRSTVGTSTEIYDYMKLLFARIGKTISPVSGKLVKRQSVRDVSEYIHSFPENTKIILLSPVKLQKERTLKQQLELLLQQGFSRVQKEKEIVQIADIIQKKLSDKETYNLVIDRFTVKKDDEDNQNRISDSVQTSFFEGEGECIVSVVLSDKKTETRLFSNRFELDGISFEEPSVHLFSFNNPIGACKTCEGFGSVIGIDENLVIPNPSLSLYEDAIACWKGESMSAWKKDFIKKVSKYDFPIHRPYNKLTKDEKKLLWKGNEDVSGIDDFFKHLEAGLYKIQYRVMLARYRGKTLCPECEGTRLRKDASYVKIGSRSIHELVLMPVKDLLAFVKKTVLNEYEKTVAKRIVTELENRLRYLEDVGLGYLTMNRLSNTLSGGESQRINLATSLGSSLVGSMYILDEPSIGLHSRDTQRLISVLKNLRNIGNTVIVVEHDEEIMRSADELIDIGPGAGTHGGEVVFQGNQEELLADTHSLTAGYLSGREKIDTPTQRRNWKHFIEIKGARENNLKNIDVKFPINTLCVITGVSGSGKTSLVKRILYPALKKHYEGYGELSGQFGKLEGNPDLLKNVEMVDQNPIGKSSRSNPVTYVKAYDEIRALFADQPLAKTRGYKPSHFSFNVEGGRCEICEGEGEVTIEMQFMADIHLVCEACGGRRFKSDVLEITYQEKNISEILELTVDDAIDFFAAGADEKSKNKTPGNSEKKITEKLRPLSEVGLGYIHLGQSSSTLSGGEAQRVKLASFLSKGSNSDQLLFIFDEPTTGLHFHDIRKLLKAFNALLAQGHSLLVIEHNTEVIKCADWIIDLGPEGGEEGGHLVYEGVPEGIINCKNSYTGMYLKGKM